MQSARLPAPTPGTACLLLWAILVLAVSGQVARADTTLCSEMTASGNPEYPPLLWRPKDDPDRLIGVIPALLREMLAPLGVRVQSRYMGSWARVLRLAKTGEIDLVAGAFIAPDRFQYMDYVQPPIIHLSSSVWVPKGQGFPYQHWQDLKKLTGTTLIGNSFGEEFDHYARANLTIEHVRSIIQSFRMARAGRVDYVLYEQLQGQVKLAREGLADQFEALPRTVSEEDLYLTLSRKSHCNTPEFRAKVASRLRTMIDTGRVDELVDEYTRRYIHGR